MQNKFAYCTEVILGWLLVGMLGLGSGTAWAQETGASTPAAPAAAAPAAEVTNPQVNVNVPAPNVDVRVEAPAPPATTVIETTRPGSSTHTSSSNTSVSEKTVVQPATPPSFDPMVTVGIGVAVVVGLGLLVSALNGKSRTKTSVTTVR